MRSLASLVLVAASCSASHPVPQATTTIVDSHVHLAYLPVASQLAAHGVGAVVDLACPERDLDDRLPLRVIRSGPMLTHPRGYPLDSWGSDGYGVGCADVACVDETIDRLVAHGAGVIKLALGEDGLDPQLVPAAVARAHARGVKVAAHALSDASARLAADADVDVLAHTPVELLSGATIAAWETAAGRGPRAVISTLAAFGGTPAAIANLSKLREAGLVVLYGTDLGNLEIDGPSDQEISLLKRAGLGDAAVKAAMTTVPWHFWGFDSR
jgi:hypothetical protein